jgi:hypothetical protein
MMKGSKGMHKMPGGVMMSDKEMATAMATRPMGPPKTTAAKPKTKKRKLPPRFGRK